MYNSQLNTTKLCTREEMTVLRNKRKQKFTA